MKPLKISFSAFGPYTQETVLDFSDLKDRSFFLIHGPTGAGKTTILDAMCFALYGDASGQLRTAKMLRSNQADPSQATEVLFSFAIGTAVYRVWRSPEQERPKKRGEGMTLRAADALLYRIDGEEKLVAQGYARVTEYIEGLLGFKSSQFRQVVLLPQGEFRQLLTANSAQRQEIMETLFKTEFYRQIEESLKAKAKTIENERSDTVSRQEFILEEVQVKSPAELVEKAKLLDLAIDEQRVETKALLEKQQLAQQADAAAKLTESQFKAAEEAAAELAACQKLSETVAAYRLRFQAAEKAAALRDFEIQVKNFAAEAQRQQQSLTAIKEKLERCQQLSVQAAASWKTEEAKEEERKAADAQVLRFASFTGQLADLKAAQQQTEKFAAAVRQQAAEKVSAEAALTAVRETLHSLQQRQQRLLVEAARAAQLQLKAAELEVQAKRLQTAAALEQQVEASQEIFSRQQANFQAADELYHKTATECERLQYLFQQGQAALLAADLKAGQPCPVCGAIKHPQPAVSTQLIPREDEVRASAQCRLEAEKSRMRAQRSFEEAKAKLESLEKQLKDSRREGKQGESLSAVMAELEQTATEAAAAGVAADEVQRLQPELEKMVMMEKLQVQQVETAGESHRQASGRYQAAVAVEQERKNALPEDCQNPEKLLAAQQESCMRQKNLYEALETARRQKQQADQNLAAAMAAEEAGVQAFTEAQARLGGSQEDFERRCHAAGFMTLADYELAAAWSDEKREELKNRIRAFDDRLAAATESNRKAAAATSNAARPDLKKITEELQTAQTAYNQAYARCRQAEAESLRLQEKISQLEALAEKTAASEARYRIIGTLAAVAGGKNVHGMTFQRFVLKSLLADVIDASNMRLKVMSRGQYRLQPTDERVRRNAAGGLEIEVFDNYTGYARPIATLSGGETFLASLCLALGLADVVQSYAGGIHLDTILVDEGFGTLDPESLDMALKALLDLQKGGRLVGIISHVPELKERIDARLEVTKGRHGSTAAFSVG